MDFRFAPQQNSFREEVREFFEQELPPGYVGPAMVADEEDFTLHFQMKKKLAERDWIGLGFPKEYGGQAAGKVTQAIFVEEYAYARSVGLDRMGIKMIGPTLLVHGTEEQRQRFIPRILEGDIEWCQGYSEPGTGSDLASLQTRAVEDGDDFVLNGTKIWTSKAPFSDWMFLLARTDPDAPKHKGISFFLCPMNTPGITVTPIKNMMGVEHFAQVFFDNVRVPREYLVGEKNRGWYVGMTLLDFERSGAEWPGYSRRMLDEVVQYCRETERRGRPMSQDPQIRSLIANTAIEIEAGRLICYNIAWLQDQGKIPSQEASIGKLYNTELLQRVSQAWMQILGLYGLLDREAKGSPLHGLLPRLYMGSRAGTIFAGSSEVQRNIIATRGLGLPRI